MVESKTYTWGTGRRKTSVARVRIRPGTGQTLINGRALENYFSVEQHRVNINEVILAAGVTGAYDIFARINGGGIAGQAGALRLGIARALRLAQPELEQELRDGGFLTRDARMVERKKYGQPKARKRFQFSKR